MGAQRRGLSAYGCADGSVIALTTKDSQLYQLGMVYPTWVDLAERVWLDSQKDWWPLVESIGRKLDGGLISGLEGLFKPLLFEYSPYASAGGTLVYYRLLSSKDRLYYISSLLGEVLAERVGELDPGIRLHSDGLNLNLPVMLYGVVDRDLAIVQQGKYLVHVYVSPKVLEKHGDQDSFMEICAKQRAAVVQLHGQYELVDVYNQRIEA